MPTNRISPNYKGFVGTLGGVPTAGSSGLPLTIPFNLGGYEIGRYYFVGKGGNDGSDGLTWAKRKLTIASAVTASNADINWSGSPWGTNNVIVVGHGAYAENLTALPYGATIVGLGDSWDQDNGQNGVLIKPASGSPFDATSVINTHVYNLAFESPDSSPAFDVENCNRNVFRHCVFKGRTADDTSHAFRVKDETNADGNGDCTGTRWDDCLFHRAVIGLEIETDNGSSKQASGNIIENSYFTGISSKGIYFHIHCVPSFTVINNCVVGDGSTTLALGLDDDTSQVGVYNTMFTATANDPATADGGKYNNSYLNSVLLTNS